MSDRHGRTTSVLADIRDRERVLEVFREHRPQVVFHAAAHKHVPILEEHPQEAFLTNVLGTANVVEAATLSGAERFVLISTDKAVRPTSVMGGSKRMAEQIVRGLPGHGTVLCAVRFGNVLGSRGSVVPTFLSQIAAGGPVTVTDPEMTRYFMSVEEAVQLVLQAGALARGGEVFTLEMGEPVNILDLANRLIRLSGRVPGRDIAVQVIGARPGEKLHEELTNDEEAPESTGCVRDRGRPAARARPCVVAPGSAGDGAAREGRSSGRARGPPPTRQTVAWFAFPPWSRRSRERPSRRRGASRDPRGGGHRCGSCALPGARV